MLSVRENPSRDSIAHPLNSDTTVRRHFSAADHNGINDTQILVLETNLYHIRPGPSPVTALSQLHKTTTCLLPYTKGFISSPCMDLNAPRRNISPKCLAKLIPTSIYRNDVTLVTLYHKFVLIFYQFPTTGNLCSFICIIRCLMSHYGETVLQH